MSTDQQPAPHDPRYDGIYQRGGQAPVRTPDGESRPVAADERRPTTTPQFTDEQRRIGARPVAPTPDSARAQNSTPESAIREVGTEPEAPEVSVRARNPFDVWVWTAAGVLTVLGAYFLAAPILSAEAYAQAMMSQSSTNMYSNPWYIYTINVAPTLILLGIGTAVVQLFVLSLRHTLRAR